MDASFSTAPDLVRPWRRATVVASVVAALELVLLLGAGSLLIAKPVARSLRHHAQAAAVAAPPKKLVQAIRRMNAPVGKARARSHVKIMVFNGNGLSGAAASEAGKLHGLGYKVSGTANARHQNYATSVVMYKPGYRAEGLRLARELGVKVVGPLDGIHAKALQGGELAVIVGA
jgi:LytR cell envelope-related transcriptional attenuator